MKKDYYSHITTLKRAKELLVLRDEECHELSREVGQLGFKIRELEEYKEKQENLLKLAKKEKKTGKINLHEVSVISSPIFETEIILTDYYTDENGKYHEIEYYGIRKRHLNDFLIDSGEGMYQQKVRLHIELIEED
jgi:hypothetical protein